MYKDLKKSSITRYKNSVEKNLSTVNSAIHKGAYLSEAEWFDFNFKCAFCGVNYITTKKYSIFNSTKVYLAKVYAEAFKVILSLCSDGYSNNSFVKKLKGIVKLLKRTDKRCKSYFCDGYDKDGYLYVQVGCNLDKVPTYEIGGIEDAVDTIIDVIRDYTHFVDCKIFNYEFSKYIDGYIIDELDVVLENRFSVPYTDNSKKVTLEKFLSESKRNSYKVDGKIITIA